MALCQSQLKQIDEILTYILSSHYLKRDNISIC